MDAMLKLLKPGGVLVDVGLPEHASTLRLSSLTNGNKVLAGSQIGGIAETQEVLDFCAANGVVPQVEIITGEDITANARVIEDIPHLADGPADRPMRALLQAMNNSDHMLIADAEISRASGSIGVLGEWKAGRQGIVLKPDTYDGDSIFKTSFGRVKRSDFPVGRGMFVQAGRAITMQVPLVPSDG